MKKKLNGITKWQGYKAPTRHFLPPNAVSGARNELHVIEILAKGAYGNPQMTQVVAKAVSCSPQIGDKALSLKTMLTYLIENGVVELLFN